MNAKSTIYGKTLPWALSMLLALGLVFAPHPTFAQGNIRSRMEYYLNPDGSGKVKASQCFRKYEASGKPRIRTKEEVLRDIAGTKPFELDKLTKPFQLEAVKAYEIHVGIAGWECSSFTGYFPNITGSYKKGFFGDPFMRYRLRREENGLRLEAEWPLLDEYFEYFFRGLSDLNGKDEQEKWIENKQKEWKQKLKEEDWLYRNLYGWRFEEVIHLPGRVESASNFRREGENTLRILLGNWKLMAAFRVTHQEHVLREMAAANSTEPGRREAMKILFGADAPIEAIVAGPLEPLFDYSKEVAAAKAAFPAMLKRLGVEAKEVTEEKK